MGLTGKWGAGVRTLFFLPDSTEVRALPGEGSGMSPETQDQSLSTHYPLGAACASIAEDYTFITGFSLLAKGEDPCVTGIRW